LTPEQIRSQYNFTQYNDELNGIFGMLKGLQSGINLTKTEPLENVKHEIRKFD